MFSQSIFLGGDYCTLGLVPIGPSKRNPASSDPAIRIIRINSHLDLDYDPERSRKSQTTNNNNNNNNNNAGL